MKSKKGFHDVRIAVTILILLVALATANVVISGVLLNSLSQKVDAISVGKMSEAELSRVMQQMHDGEVQVLVCTTIIETGLDIPNANTLIIENADRFGLSQLHQLRGRVGRGKAKSFCILTSHNKNPDTLQRLKALCKTTDGFQIAEDFFTDIGCESIRSM